MSAPHLASTVLLFRDAPQGPEVFMVKRASTVRFMGGVHVFPGGRLDANDSLASLLGRCNLQPENAAQNLMFSEEKTALALYVAAFRELFEEAGVLLATNASGQLVDTALPPFPEARDSLNQGQLGFSTLAEQQNLFFLADQLRCFARWITPEFETKRFDTYFFIAAAPAESMARHDAHETVASCWIRPQDALQQSEAGEILLAPPTVKALELFAPASSSRQAFTLASAWKPVALCPEFQMVDELPAVVLPGDPLSSSQERLYPGATRYVLKDGAWKAG